MSTHKWMVRYRSVDGAREARSFRTEAGARKRAAHWVGDHPEIGGAYAIAGDGVGKVAIEKDGELLGRAALEAFFNPKPKTLCWQDKAIAATGGSQLGAILRCAFDRNLKGVNPQFQGKASVTSDGYLMCNFVDGQGRGHMGAFVGGVSDLHRNVASLANHLKLSGDEHDALRATVQAWIGRDWR